MNTKVLGLVVGGGLLLLVLLAAAIYTPYLGTRVAPGLGFKILGPDTVRTGEPATIVWDTSPDARYPNEKIELCRGKLFGQQCVTLLASTPNKGSATVTIPRGVKTGAGHLRLTARDAAGQLVPRLSSSRPVTVAAGSGRAVISPTNVGGGTLSGVLTPTGPRIGVARDSSYRIILPNATVNKKIELCQGPNKCRVLASNAQGSEATIKIPSNLTDGPAYVRVSERGNDGTLTGKITYQRAILVTKPAPVVAQRNEGSGGGDSGGGGGGGGNDRGGDNGDGGQAPPSEVPVNPGTASTATFISPVSGATFAAGEPIPVQVHLQWQDDPFTCQEWLLDGQPIANAAWVNGQSPDSSAGPCT